MLQKVRSYWIEGMLELSLYDSPLITPTLLEKQDAVATPWPSPQYQIEKKTAKPAQTLSITEAYDEAGGDLLILGEAGSGKTTHLLQLARHLIARAEHNDSFSLPVIFLLSSWAAKQLPIDQWLIEELNDKYQVPRLLAGQWLHSEMLLPLLDGLDEVPSKARSSCIVAINTYKQQHGLNPLVVCSRLTDYLLSPPRVHLQRAIVVQPLTLQQVDIYFKNAGANFAAIYQILRGDLGLYGLITTPLMLNIITLAYQNKSSADLLMMQSSTQRYQSILATYVEQMLRHYPTKSADTPQQLTNRLTYLAKNMQQQGNTIFYIEHLQPTWIPNSSWREVYRWLAVLLPGVLIGGLTGFLATVLHNRGVLGSLQLDMVYGMVMGFLFSSRPPAALPADQPPSSLNHPIPSPVKSVSLQTALFVSLTTLVFMGSAKGWTAGLINGLLLGILSLPIQKLYQRSSLSPRPSPDPEHTRSHPWRKLFPLNHVKNSLPIGIACGLTSIVTFLVNHDAPEKTFAFFLSLGLSESLHNILLGIILSMLLTQNTGMISCADIFSWSWKRFLSAFQFMDILFNLLVGLVIGLIFGIAQLFQDNLSDIIHSAVSTAVLFTICIRLTVAISQGISSNTLNDHHRRVPNEGMKRSFFHGNVSFALGLVIFACFTLMNAVLSLLLTSGPAALVNQRNLQGGLPAWLIHALLLGPAGALLIALLLGWLASWQHTVLRLILRINNVLPLRLSRLLDDATDSVLLRRIGGGYIFIHRTLLEYFASLRSAQEPSQEKEQVSSLPEPLVRLL